ncbi:uncharacterized protein LY89DRAFT_691529 [Mollisia scopiformis]|uniref:Pre-mRNA-splicing factor n=1 Tax=Mollisia scopiformis TaxID=149040 RepID=A0A132B677_MOLSC|nr:uncharacterized protein LY89DRAFT_691529 [Mollisia scopiformis]KUJ07841.1 hypothetical protein LY89DRAFT_691529 [Mollisia scopiformis]
MSPSKDDPPAPKISIKGFSLSAKPSSSTSKPKPPPATLLGKRPRSTFAAAHDDSDSDGEHSRGKVETVHGFEDGGAVNGEKKASGALLVIPKQKNRDWKAEARGRGRGGKNLLPAEVQAAQEAARKEREGRGSGKEEGVDVVNSKDGEIEWGLSVRKRVKVDEEEPTPTSTPVVEEEKVEGKAEEKPKTADEEALAALLGQNKEKRGPDLIIKSETDAYRQAIASAPEASTLEDYERVPVEEFGAALLRGMGWKGESHGKVKDVKRRQNLLGLGAKELKEAEELGAWVHKSDVKRLQAGGDKRGERRPRVSEYRREEERRRERRGGSGYRDERERERRR